LIYWINITTLSSNSTSAPAIITTTSNAIINSVSQSEKPIANDVQQKASGNSNVNSGAEDPKSSSYQVTNLRYFFWHLE
jgi:hypothetical protein